jgi:hypothetical protein
MVFDAVAGLGEIVFSLRGIVPCRGIVAEGKLWTIKMCPCFGSYLVLIITIVYNIPNSIISLSAPLAFPSTLS